MSRATIGAVINLKTKLVVTPASNLKSSIVVTPQLFNYVSRTVKLLYLTDEGCSTEDARTILTVEPVTARSSKITWKDLPVYDADEVFYIQKSGSSRSGWVTLGKATIMDSSFLDETANNTMNRHDIEYYRILCPASLQVFGVVRVEGHLDPYGAEMARRHRIMLHEGLNGNKMYVFTRIRNGARCPDCWDETLQQRSTVDCPTCKDTGYIVGYYNPVEMYMSFSSEAVSIQNNIDGPAPAPDTMNAWTGNFPLLNIGDVVVEPIANRFWEVQSANLTMHKRVVTKQEIVLAKQEGDDPVLSLINRLPIEGDDGHGQCVFEDDSENSEGIYDSVSPELLPKAP